MTEATKNDRLCPILTAASLKGEDGEAVACQGDACMWYMPVRDGQGRPLQGQCAAYQFAIGLSLVNISVREAAKLDTLITKKV